MKVILRIFNLFICFLVFCQTEKKPNILFLMTDQHSMRVLGSYGNQIIKTPNLDKLANEGLKFINI